MAKRGRPRKIRVEEINIIKRGRGRPRKIKTEDKIEDQLKEIKKEDKFVIDLSRYEITEITFPFHIKEKYRLFHGDENHTELSDCIQEFEKKYGIFDKVVVYWNKSSIMAGFVVNIKEENKQ